MYLSKKGALLADVIVECCDTEKETLARLTHELGHLVAGIFQTPAVKNDARYYKATSIGMTRKELRSVLANEREAWKLARKIFPEVSKKQEREALREYEQILKGRRAVNFR
jgi:hypothetical protein